MGCGTAVFENLELRPITSEEIAGFDRRYYGLDFGWYPDPNQMEVMAYDAPRRTLYIFDEHRAIREKDEQLAEAIKKYIDCEIIADSAGNKSIATLRDLGFRKMRGCVKYSMHGGTSGTEGMKGLQSRAKIVIDPKRCPTTAREFSEYEYAIDKKTNEVIFG